MFWNVKYFYSNISKCFSITEIELEHYSQVGIGHTAIKKEKKRNKTTGMSLFIKGNKLSSDLLNFIKQLHSYKYS